MSKILAFSCIIEQSEANGIHGTAAIATNLKSFWDLLESIPDADKVLWVLERFAPINLTANKVEQNWYGYSNMFQQMFNEISRYLTSVGIPNQYEHSEIIIRENSGYTETKWSIRITILDEMPKKPAVKRISKY